MKKKWSRMWVKSVQPRKQRKYRHNAPLHVRHKFLSVNLSPEIRDRFEKRSMPVRKGDEVEVMRGSVKGLRGTVNRVDMKNSRVYVEEIKVKKVDGSEVMRPLQPSNLKITKMTLDDKRRQMVIDRAEKKPETKKKEEKKEHKSEKKQESKPKTRRIKKHRLRAHKNREKKNRPRKHKAQHKTEKKPEKKETKAKPTAVKSKEKAVKKGKAAKSKK